MVIPFGPLNESNREVGPIVIWGTTITRMLPLINMAVSLRVRHDNPQLTISEIDIQVQQSKSSKQGAHENSLHQYKRGHDTSMVPTHK